MKKLVIIFVVSASTDMIMIILQWRDKIMNEKMEKVVQELRKRFRGSIEFYDVPYTEQYKIEYCLNGLYITKLLSYDFIKKKDTREIVLSLNILIISCVVPFSGIFCTLYLNAFKTSVINSLTLKSPDLIALLII